MEGGFNDVALALSPGASSEQVIADLDRVLRRYGGVQAQAALVPCPGSFGRWLDRHHASKTELIVGYHKVDSGKPSMTWSESVDQALCYGWIDGVRRRIDEVCCSIR